MSAGVATAGGETPPAPRVCLRGIVKTFGSHQALRGVDLDLYPGECLGLVGDNAAGKSTLTKIISGTYVPDGGTIEIDGDPVSFSTRPKPVRAISRWSFRTSASAIMSTWLAISIWVAS